MNPIIVAASLALAAHVFGPLPVRPTVVMDRQPSARVVAWVDIDASTWTVRDYVIHLTPYIAKAGLLCEGIVHEYGHLAGRRHTNTGVMRSAIEWWHGCDKVMRRPPLRPDPPPRT